MEYKQASPTDEDRKVQVLTSGRVSRLDKESPEVRTVLEDERGILFSPNHIPLATRRQYIFFSTILLAYGVFGAWVDDIYVPGKRGPGVHFHGVPLWFLVFAMFAASANMISVVVDHYDRRNNEINYRRFARFTQILAWALFAAGFLLDLFLFKASTRS